MKRFGWLFSLWVVAAVGSSACAPGLQAGGQGEGGDPGVDGSGATGTGSKPSHTGGGEAVGGGGGDDASESGGGPSNTGGDGAGASGSGGDSSTGGAEALGPPGKPGHAVVAGGSLMYSTNFMLVATTGESPGGNSLMHSKQYRLVSGVLATSE